jgi:hypothetical protein
MSGFKDYIDDAINQGANKAYRQKQPLINQAAGATTGSGTLTKINKDGTVDCILNGQEFKSISPSSTPPKLNMPVMLVAGKKALW